MLGLKGLSPFPTFIMDAFCYIKEFNIHQLPTIPTKNQEKEKYCDTLLLISFKSRISNIENKGGGGRKDEREGGTKEESKTYQRPNSVKGMANERWLHNL